MAELREEVTGSCEIFVIDNPRTFKLKQTAEGCGSKTYEGRRREGRGVSTLRITDHLHRTCRDLVDAKIIVEETTGAGAAATTRKLYSGASAPASVVLEGTLRSSAGIGGENTGMSRETAEGLVELVLGDADRASFTSRTRSRSTGARSRRRRRQRPDGPLQEIAAMRTSSETSVRRGLGAARLRVGVTGYPGTGAWKRLGRRIQPCTS